MDFRSLLSPDFLDLNRSSRMKSGDKGDRYLSYSSKLPLRSFFILLSFFKFILYSDIAFF